MQPVVSIRIASYNHEQYIAQCLEGILMQRTNFPFEIIIGEHSSTDRTKDIVLKYLDKYPTIIQLFTTGREMSPSQNHRRIQTACSGKYQAMCDGDDYWIDPLKLQKQVNFMEIHPEVTMCFHNAFVTRADIYHARYYYTSALKEILEFEDVYLKSIPTSAIMARSEVLNAAPEWRVNVMHGDQLLRLWCAHQGSLGYLNDVMSVYRMHAGSMTASVAGSHEEWFSNTVYMCQEFNKTTNYRYAALMENYIRWAKTYRQRARWGKLYYLLFPHRSKGRFKALYQAIKRT